MARFRKTALRRNSLFPLKLTFRRLTTEIFSLSGISMTREGAYDSLREVLNMKSQEQISYAVDSWIEEEELPARAGLKFIKRRDPDYGLTKDEKMDRKEFIRCYLFEDFAPLMMIPKQDGDDDFFIGDFPVDAAEYSPFNTHDFQRQLRPFNKYGYAMKMIMERVRDLAILHSSISDQEGRLEIFQRYEALIYREFRDDLLILASRYKKTNDDVKRRWLKQKIAKINLRILECRSIWERFAPPENWDR
jgi:hypothetical protein